MTKAFTGHGAGQIVMATNLTVGVLEQPLPDSAALNYAPPVYSGLDDSALMLRYADGDQRAFEALYRRHNDALYRYLLRLTGNRNTAEDVFQDAWGKLINARKRYRPTAKFNTYLFRVAHNCFIDHLRRNRRHMNEAAVDPDLSPDTGFHAEQLAESELARRRLDLALATLPIEQRDVFLLHQESGLTIDEIATITGVNRETAKSRFRYAVAKLRTALATAPDVGDKQ